MVGVIPHLLRPGMIDDSPLRKAAMDSDDTIGLEIGARLKAIRLHRRMTLRQVAAQAGISVGLLSQIERGISSSTIATIQRIAGVLGTGFATLLDTHAASSGEAKRPREGAASPVAIVRRDARNKLLMPFGGTMELLAPVHDKRMEFILIRHPVGSKVREPFTHEGEECGLVLQGTLKVIVGDEAFILVAGDSIYFESTVPHRWENVGEVEVLFVSTLTPPSL